MLEELTTDKLKAVRNYINKKRFGDLATLRLRADIIAAIYNRYLKNDKY